MHVRGFIFFKTFFFFFFFFFVMPFFLTREASDGLALVGLFFF